MCTPDFLYDRMQTQASSVAWLLFLALKSTNQISSLQQTPDANAITWQIYRHTHRTNTKHNRMISAYKGKTCEKCEYQTGDYWEVEERGKLRVDRGELWAPHALFLSVSREGGGGGSNRATWEKTSVLGVLERLACDRISCSGRIMKGGKTARGVDSLLRVSGQRLSDRTQSFWQI